MEYYGKNKKIYNGVWFPFITILVFPVIVFFLFKYVFTWTGRESEADKLAFAFASLCAVFFDLSCMAHGFIHDCFIGFVRRIKETLEYFKPFSKGSWSYYFHMFIEDGGPIMWIFILIFAVTIGFTIYSWIVVFN